jgi:hypothetical protein
MTTLASASVVRPRPRFDALTLCYIIPFVALLCFTLYSRVLSSKRHFPFDTSSVETLPSNIARDVSRFCQVMLGESGTIVEIQRNAVMNERSPYMVRCTTSDGDYTLTVDRQGTVLTMGRDAENARSDRRDALASPLTKTEAITQVRRSLVALGEKPVALTAQYYQFSSIRRWKIHCRTISPTNKSQMIRVVIDQQTGILEYFSQKAGQ